MTITSFPSIFSTAGLRFLKCGYFPILRSPPNFRACKCLSLLSLPWFSEWVFIKCLFCVRLSTRFWDPKDRRDYSCPRKLSLLVDKNPPTDGHIKMTMQRPRKDSGIQASTAQVERKGGGSFYLQNCAISVCSQLWYQRLPASAFAVPTSRSTLKQPKASVKIAWAACFT